MSRAPPLIDHIVPTAQLTAEVNLTPRHQHAPASSESPDIDIGDCLGFLHLVAMGCEHDESAIERFWRIMRLDFVHHGLFLRWQRREDVLAMLRLLGTSNLEHSFGPIRAAGGGGDEANGGAAQAAANLGKILDRISAFMLSFPAGVDARDRYTRAELAELRIEVLGLLGVMSCTEYGGQLLVRHKTILGRVVRVLNEELDTLYYFRVDHNLW